MNRRRWKPWWWGFEFKPQDCWIGGFWRIEDWKPCQGYQIPSDLHIWICFVPMVPLHLMFKEVLDE